MQFQGEFCVVRDFNMELQKVIKVILTTLSETKTIKIH